MPKLQLYLARSANAYKSLVNINPSSETQHHVPDLTEALKSLAYDPAEKYIFFAVHYLQNAVLFSIIRTIPEILGHHLAATIAIPTDVDITGDELLAVVKSTISKLRQPVVSAEDQAELRSIYAADYPARTDAPSIDSSHGAAVAVAFYGGNEGLKMSDIIRQGLFRPELAAYKCVLLADKALGVTALTNDLGELKEQKQVVVLPPEASPEGFEPHVYGHPFTSPVIGAVGVTMRIVWERAGYEHITTKFVPDVDATAPEVPDTSAARKSVSPATFLITSRQTHKPLTGCTIKVNGVLLVGPRSFTIAQLKRATVVIECEGYRTFSGIVDLASTSQAAVQMQPVRKVYRFELPVDTDDPCDPVKFEITSPRELLRCPVEGYELTDPLREGENYSNRLTPKRITPQLPGAFFLMSVGIGSLILGLLLGWLLFRSHGPRVKKTPEPTAIEAPATPATPAIPADSVAQDTIVPTLTPQPVEAENAPEPEPDRNLAQLVNYLDNERVWTRQGLAQFPEAEGLFDDMNNYEFKRLRDYWGPKLQESHSFAKVAYAAKRAIITKKNPRRKGHLNAYNRPGDDQIQWIGYIYWIDP